MQVMDVDVVYLIWQFTGHDTGLPKAAQAIGRRIAPQVAEKNLQQATEAISCTGRSYAPDDAPWFFIQVLRQVSQWRSNTAMHHMDCAVSRSSQGPDFKTEAKILKRQQLLCDEGLGKAGIAFHHHHKRDRLRLRCALLVVSACR